jgi:hypothetical protein
MARNCHIGFLVQKRAIQAWLAAAGTFFLFQSLAVAQEDPAADQGAPVVASATFMSQITEPVFDEREGEYWVRGRTYKARFNAEGFTCIPWLGSTAERNAPLQFTLQSVTVGEESMTLLAALPQRNGSDIIFDRGPLHEAYHVEVDSIEQTFVIEHKPEMPGDLNLRIALHTDDVVAADIGDAIEFTHSRGSVRYSKAVLVDANQSRTDLMTRLSDGAIEIQVPASFLEASEYPITIDPIILMFTAYDDDMNNHWPDVAYDASTDGYLVVWENQFSAADGDIFARHINSNGVPASPLFVIDSTGENWRRPRIANNNIANNFLVVVQRGASPNRVIWGRTCSTVATTSSPFQIGDPAAQAGDQFNADIGGDPVLVGPTYYFVVWERVFSPTDLDIHGRLVNSNATNAGALLILDNSTVSDVHPAISSSDGVAPFASQNWTIVWERLFSSTDHDIVGAQVRWDGVITHASYSIDISGLDHRFPAVSTLLDEDVIDGERRYMVVYEERQNDIAYHIWGRALRGSAFITDEDLIALENVPGCAMLPDVCWAFGPVVESTTDARFVVASIQHNAFVSQYCLSGNTLRVAEQHRPLDTNFDFKIEVNLAGVHAGGGNAAQQFMAAFNDPFTQVEEDNFGHILGTRYDTKNSCCLADVNDDGVINVPDLLVVINQWAAFCALCAGDVNGDLSVNVPDLLDVINAWGACP